MKKKLCVLLVALLCLQLFPIAAQEEEGLLFFDDFEKESLQSWESIGGTPSIACEEKNHVYSVSAQDFFEKESMSGYRNYTYSFQMKMDYRDAEGNFGNTWPTLRFRVSDSAYYHVYLYNKTGAEEIGVQKFVGSQETWLATASPKLTEDNEKWVSVKIELAGQNVKIYYKNLKEPLISFTDSEGETPAGGGFCFIANGVSKFYLDDLKVVRGYAPTEAAEKIVKTNDRELIHFFDYEKQSGDTIREEAGNRYYIAEQEVVSAECEDFITRFRWRRDYYPYGKNIPRFSFGDGYVFELESSLENAAVILKQEDRELARAELCFADYDKAWTSVGFSAEQNEICFYWNDMSTPILVYEADAAIRKGSISLCGGDLDDWYLASAYRLKPIEIISSETAEEENNLRWTLRGVSHEESDREITAIAAAFSDGVLCAKSIQAIKFFGNDCNSTEKRETELFFSLPKQENTEWKCFFWDGMTPLADVVVMGEVPTRKNMPPKSEENPTLEVKAEAKNEIFQISGTVGEASQSISLLLQAFSDSKEPSYDKLIFLEQLTPNPNGSFSVSIPAEKSLPEGDYQVYAASDDCTITFSDTEFLREGNIASFLLQWNQAGTKESLRDLLLDKANFRYARRLGLKPQLFAALEQEHLQLGVMQRVLEQKEDDFTEENVGTCFAPHLAFALLKTAKSGEEIRVLFAENSDLYSSPKLYQEAEKKLQAEAMEGILHGLKEGRYDTVAEAEEELEQNMILASIYLANYKDIPQLLEQYQQQLGIDLKETNTLTSEQKTLAYQAMNGKRCYTYSEFLSLYQSAVTQAKEPIATPKPTRKPSGGGGGGGKTAITVDPLPTVAPTATPIRTESPLYSDLLEGHWAKEAVEYLSAPQRAVISGYEDGCFYPDRPVTRAEFVKLIVKAFRLEENGESVSFDDVSDSAWYAPDITIAAQNGIVTGTDGSFFPQQEITRQDMAVMLYRVAQKKMLSLEKNRDCRFSDEKQIAVYAEKAVKVLAEAGIVSGVSEHAFQPLESATRAQAAKMIYEMIK